MFDGKVKQTKSYARKTSGEVEGRGNILEKARKQREERAKEKHKQLSATRIQAFVRMSIARRSMFRKVRADFDKRMNNVMKMKQLFKARKGLFIVPITVVVPMMKSFFFFYDKNLDDAARLPQILVLFQDSVSAENKQVADNIWLSVSNSCALDCGWNLESVYSMKSSISSSSTKGKSAGDSEYREGYFMKGLLSKLYKICIRYLYLQSSNSTSVESVKMLKYLSQCSKSDDLSSAALSNAISGDLIKDCSMCIKSLFTSKLSESVSESESESTSGGDDEILNVLISIVECAVETYDTQTEAESQSQSGKGKGKSYEDNAAWRALVFHVLSIPDIFKYNALKGLLDMLSKNNFAGWILAIQSTSFSRGKGEKGEEDDEDYEEIDKVWILVNFFSCTQNAADPENSISLAQQYCWLGVFNQALDQLPLFSILFNKELGGNGHREMTEVAFSEIVEGSRRSLDGINRLEFQISHCKDQMRDLESGSWLKIRSHISNFTPTLSKILNGDFMKKVFQHNLDLDHIDDLNANNAKEFEGNPMERGLNVLRIYAKVLLSTPSRYGIVGEKKASVGATSNGLLNEIAFSNPQFPLPRQIWNFLTSNFGTDGLELFLSTDKLEDIDTSVREGVLHGVFLFFSSLSHQLNVTDDDEFFGEKVLLMSEVFDVIHLTKKLLLRVYESNSIADEPATQMKVMHHNLLEMQLHLATMRLFNQLYHLDNRKQFVEDSLLWQWSSVRRASLEVVGESENGVADIFKMDYQKVPYRWAELDGPLADARMWSVLSCCPQVLPFEERVIILQEILADDKEKHYGGASIFQMWNGMSTRIKVHRDRIAADAFNQLKGLRAHDLRNKIQIEFISGEDRHEAGIDGGGLYMEFMELLIKEVFDPAFGLFKSTTSNLLIPNADSDYYHDDYEIFNFIGKMFGKAMYDSILVESQFSVVMLNVILGRLNQFDDLLFYDEELYRSLMKLKHMSASSGVNIEDLDMNFEVQRANPAGEIITYELVPGGSYVKVTKSNITQYRHRYANHKLNSEIQAQCKAFQRGFRELIDVQWMRMFSAKELQKLISGDEKGIDIEDFKRNINYASGYEAHQPYMMAFWDIIANMSLEEQGNFLKFITSCSRQPLLGFKQLDPLICIQRVPQYSQEQFESEQGAMSGRLPSAATCMNLLKLPEYDSPEILKEKLLYAITNNNTGFELS